MGNPEARGILDLRKSGSWKQPKCPWTEEWIKKMWDTYTMKFHSAIKMNETMPFAAASMGLEMII